MSNQIAFPSPPPSLLFAYLHPSHFLPVKPFEREEQPAPDIYITVDKSWTTNRQKDQVHENLKGCPYFCCTFVRLIEGHSKCVTDCR